MAFFISLAALTLIALLFLRIKSLPASAACYCAVTAAALFLCALGMLGAFSAASALIYVIAAISAALLLGDGKRRRRVLLARFFTPATVFFLAASAAFYLILYIKQPWFQQWDEFSFWGIAAKNAFERNELYTLFESSMLSTSYAPGLPLFSCFMQRLSPAFSEWRVMAAYDVMIASALSLLFSRESFKKPLRIILITLFSAFGLYMFWHSFLGARLFASAMADIQLGVMLGGALLAWFSSDDRGAGRYIACVLGLALLPMIKDMGLAFGLVAAVVITADMILARARPFKKHNWLAGPGLFAAVYFSYMAWNLHYIKTLWVDRAAVRYEYSAAQMFAGEDSFFNAVLAKMFGEELMTRQLVMFGPIIDMLVVFTAIPLLSALFCRSRRGAARLCCGSVLLLAGFLVYYLFMAYVYSAIFYHYEDLYLASFERYISSYAIGWYLALIGLVKSEAGEWSFKQLTFSAPGRRIKWPRDGGALVCLAMTAAIFYFTPVNPDQYLLTSPKVMLPLSEKRVKWRAEAETLKNELPDDAKLYLICQESDGEEWFYFNYELQPLYLCRTLEGGYFVPPSEVRNRYDTFADAAEFSEYLNNNNVDYLVVDRTDGYFEENFASLFTDALESHESGKTSLYERSGEIFAPAEAHSAN